MKNADYLDVSLPLKKRVKSLVSQLTLEEKIGLIPTRQAAVPRLGIKEFSVGNEVARGFVSHNDDEPATVFPQPIGMASMFDTKLIEKIGEIAGTELRYYHENSNHDRLVLFGPTVDLGRDPRWGRTEECYGEDPYLAGQMVKAYTKGIVGDNKDYYRACPSLKHFYANNNEKNRAISSSNIEPRTKHEYYYRAFKPAIEAGYAPGVMTSYNSINGLPAMINPDINEICKRQWGMKYAVTDGSDVVQTATHHKFTENHAQTIAMAIKCGTDIMCENAKTVIEALRYALKHGMLTEKELDKAVMSALYPRFLLGEFNPADKNPYKHISSEVVNCDKFKQINLAAAKEAIILLKNNGLLPLKKTSVKKIALLGTHAKENYRDWYTGTTEYNVTVYDGIKNLFPDMDIVFDDCRDTVVIKSLLTGKYLCVDDDGNVIADGEKDDESCKFIKYDCGSEIAYLSVKNGKYITLNNVYAATDTSLFQWFVRSLLRPSAFEGKTIFKSWNGKSVFVNKKGMLTADEKSRVENDQLFIEEITDSGIKRAEKTASECDCVIVCVGNDPMVVAREEYDRENIEFTDFQTNLANAVFSANKNTVLCIISSYPYAISKLNKKLPAIIYSAHGGAETGNAMAQTLFGSNNPAGRTSMTWYASTSELPDIMDYDIIKNKSTYLYYDGKPLYPFGYGLSYSKFKYGDLQVTDSEDKIKVCVSVENVSEIDGDEVVQIYLSQLESRYKRPLKQLCAFERKFIKAGEKAEFEFSIDKKEFGRWDCANHKYVFDEGDYMIYAGKSSDDTSCGVKMFLSGTKHMPRDISVKTLAVDYDDKKSVEIRATSDAKHEYVKGKGVFGGSITFFDCDLNKKSAVKIKATTTGNSFEIKILIDKEEAASFTLPPFVCPENFKAFEFPLEKAFDGIHDITVIIGENVNLYSLKFI